MSNKIVIVTGGSRGIGAATARLLGQEKAAVVVNGVQETARETRLVQRPTVSRCNR